MTLERFCRRPVVIVRPEDAVQRACELMRDQHVGSVLVVDGEQRPIGLVTDRDIVCRVVSAKLEAASTPVKEVMSGNVGVARRDDPLDEVLFRMRKLGVRRLPIVAEDGRAVGMVTLDDLTVMLTAELSQTGAVIRANRGP